MARKELKAMAKKLSETTTDDKLFKILFTKSIGKSNIILGGSEKFPEFTFLTAKKLFEKIEIHKKIKVIKTFILLGLKKLDILIYLFLFCAESYQPY